MNRSIVEDKFIERYKELLIKCRSEHLFYFDFQLENKQFIKGFYVIDKSENFYLSVGTLSNIFNEKVFEKFSSKFFEIDDTNQQQFFKIDSFSLSAFNQINQEFTALVEIIRSNKRFGKPRKFILNSKGIKISIEKEHSIIGTLNF